MRFSEGRQWWQAAARNTLMLVIMLILAACSAFARPTTPAEGNPPPATATPTPTPTPAVVEPVQTEPPSSDLCPSETTTFELAAAHAFWTETGMGKWNWEATGSIPIVVMADGIVGEGSQGIIPGQQFGTFSSGRNTCSFTAPAEVHISASGTCRDSLLTLKVTEEWQMGTYEWVCDDDSFQAQVPPLGAAVHPDLEFPLEPGSYPSVDVYWGGGGGSKTYTLYPNLEPVPLVTP